MVTYLANGRSPAARRAYTESEALSRIAISVITQAEIFFGMEKRPEATRLNSVFDRFLGEVQVLPWDSAAATAYGSLRAQLTRSGNALSLMDLLIASHAIAVGATLVTHDQAFRHAGPLIPIVDWATDL